MYNPAIILAWEEKLDRNRPEWEVRDFSQWQRVERDGIARSSKVFVQEAAPDGIILGALLGENAVHRSRR